MLRLRSNACLSSKIPHLEFYLFVMQGLDVEPDCRNCAGQLLARRFKMIQNRCFSSVVQSKNQDADLFGAPVKSPQYFADKRTHS